MYINWGVHMAIGGREKGNLGSLGENMKGSALVRKRIGNSNCHTQCTITFSKLRVLRRELNPTPLYLYPTLPNYL